MACLSVRFYGDGVGLTAEETKYSFNLLDLLLVYHKSLKRYISSTIK